MHTGHGNACRAAKCDTVAMNKLTAPNVFIGYRVSFCHATSVSASSAGTMRRRNALIAYVTYTVEKEYSNASDLHCRMQIFPIPHTILEQETLEH